MLTTRKAVIPGWTLVVYVSLVKVLCQSATYQACVHGRELPISLETIDAALDIAVEDDYTYPIRTNRSVVSFDVIATETSRGR